MFIIKILVVFIIAYLIGAIPWGYIIGKFHGIDIREHGSRNIGATNITRTLGKKWGVFCFFIDFLKGFIPTLLMIVLVPNLMNMHGGLEDTGIIFVILGTIVGHMYPVYLKFKGGKGVSTGTGALIAISPLGVICGLIAWVIIYKTTRYVSLASIIAGVIVPVLTIIFSAIGLYHLSLTLQITICVMGLLIIIKHKSNIVRLIKGTENKFQKK
ncbi:MAG TPA: glycerol-3-phosphate 1-O-acyltransferase PlsY [Victivallales bacterium]|nr:glycerol-3-phosphate 1-O-acyltransferase PlsY [Victivallales bacterium]